VAGVVFDAVSSSLGSGVGGAGGERRAHPDDRRREEDDTGQRV